MNRVTRKERLEVKINGQVVDLPIGKTVVRGAEVRELLAIPDGRDIYEITESGYKPVLSDSTVDLKPDIQFEVLPSFERGSDA